MRLYDRIFVDNIYSLRYLIVEGGDRVSNQASQSDIANYLSRIKSLLSEGKYDFVPRKNMQSLAQHGLTITDAKDEIFGLVAGDYYKGPKQDLDRNRPGDIWEFKKEIDGARFYIKVKIVQENGRDVLKCLGFHEDDFA